MRSPQTGERLLLTPERSLAVQNALGADLIMFGPIENVEPMVTAQAYADITILEAARDLGIDTLDPNHPINKLI